MDEFKEFSVEEFLFTDPTEDEEEEEADEDKEDEDEDAADDEEGM